MDSVGLQSWRRRLGLSQEDAAKALGVPAATYRNWEQARRAVPRWPLIDRACLEIEARRGIVSRSV